MHAPSASPTRNSVLALRPDPAAECETCGAAGAFRFDGATLCADCYAEQGSTCSPSAPDETDQADGRAAPSAGAC